MKIKILFGKLCKSKRNVHTLQSDRLEFQSSGHLLFYIHKRGISHPDLISNSNHLHHFADTFFHVHSVCSVFVTSWRTHNANARKSKYKNENKTKQNILISVRHCGTNTAITLQTNYLLRFLCAMFCYTWMYCNPYGRIVSNITWTNSLNVEDTQTC